MELAFGFEMARTSKPNCIGITPTPYRKAGRGYLAYSCLVGFPLQEPGVLLSEVDLWKLITPYLADIQYLDAGMPKPTGEWLLAGSSYAPGGMESRHWTMEIEVGNTHKQLHIHGPRQFNEQGLQEAQPINQLNIAWAHTWGGIAISENPRGCGVRGEDGQVVVPSIENPTSPWQSPDEKYIPYCTLPVDVMHPARQAKLGSYGSDYLEKYFPGFTDQFNPHFFNCAQEDQWNEGYWRGDETFKLCNLHPEHDVLTGRLPQIRCALWNAEKDQGLQQLEMNLTTVWFFPEIMTGALVYHGQMASSSFDGSEIERVIAGIESIHEPAHDQSHYERCWQLRTQRTPESGLASLDDQNLMPKGWTTRFTDVEVAISQRLNNPALKNHNVLMAEKWSNAKTLLQQQRARMQDKGVTDLSAIEEVQKQFEDYSKIITPDQTFIANESGVEKVSKQFNNMRSQQAEIQKQMQLLFADQHAKMAKANQALQQKFPDAPQAPLATEEDKAKLSAEKLHQRVDDLKKFINSKDANLDLEQQNSINQSIEKLENYIAQNTSSLEADGYVNLMNQMKAYESLSSPLPFEAMPADLNMAQAYGQQSNSGGFKPFDKKLNTADHAHWHSGQQVRNATVSELNFAGKNLSDVAWDQLKFINCDFTDVNFERATITNCQFINCNLEESNWAASQISKCGFQCCNLQYASWKGSIAQSARLFRCLMNQVELEGSFWTSSSLIESSCAHASWEAVTLKLSVFHQVDFSDSDMSQLNAMQCAWSSCNLSSSLWQQCHLMRCAFTACQLPLVWNQSSISHVSLRDAELKQSQWFKCVLQAVDFSNAKLIDANFVDATLHQIQMMGSDLSLAKFNHAVMNQSLLIGANVKGTSFDQAQLTSCWMGLIQKDEATLFENAILNSCTFNPKLADEV